MSTDDLPPVAAGAQKRTLPTALIPGGLLALAVGLVVFRAGEYAWLGLGRSAGYVGPVTLVSSDSLARVSIIVGALVMAGGASLVLLGMFDATSRVDLAARVVRARTAPAPARVGMSTSLVLGGLLAGAVGGAVGLAQPLLESTVRFQDAASAGRAVGLFGAAMSILGLAALLVGLYRLIANLRSATDAPLDR